MQFVRVVDAGMSMFSRYSWKGEVVEGKVKLKPRFNTWIFTDLQPVEYYNGRRFPNTAAECRRIDEITELEFNEEDR